jgi:hypothetical protein
MEPKVVPPKLIPILNHFHVEIIHKHQIIPL